MAFFKKLLCWKYGEESEMKGVSKKEVVLLEHMVNLSSQLMQSETWNAKLERRVKELNYERKLMEDRLDNEIKELERKEEAGTIMCAARIIQELKLTLSQWMVSENTPCMEEILPTKEMSNTAASYEASNVALKMSNNTGFWNKLMKQILEKERGQEKESKDKMEDAYLKHFQKQNEKQAQIDSRITELEKK
jgi:hypothetical protein